MSNDKANELREEMRQRAKHVLRRVKEVDSDEGQALIAEIGAVLSPVLPDIRALAEHALTLSPPETGGLVTQADREAAAAWHRLVSNSGGRYNQRLLEGSADEDPLIQAFAAHRRAALASIPSVSALQRENERLRGLDHVAAFMSERKRAAAAEARVARLEGALEEIMEIDGPYCESCHSDELVKAFQIARSALNGDG